MADEGEIRRFRDAIGRFATGVCVVTSFAESGPTGMTANAITSLSLDPLLMIVCFDRDSRTRTAAAATGRVAVNVLADGQEELSKRFASKQSEEEKFAGVAWQRVAETPVIDGSIAWFAGALTDLHPGGDHEIGIVSVEEFGTSSGDPLLYHRGAYAHLLSESP